MARRAKSRDYRDVDGILILDKPIGCSSNQALQRVRKLYQARKAGHCGSLDPLATGVLPICLGEATKFSSYLLGADKTYLASCKLGQTTATGDAEGEVLSSAAVEVDEAQVKRALESFVGKIDQIPPMHSALKHQGRRLYQLAREGIEVEREPRRVEIFQLDLLSFEGSELSLEVSCSKGTYIRTLVEDIGAQLGCGAYLSGLRRTRVDSFNVRDAISIERLELLLESGSNQLDVLLLPLNCALTQFPELTLDAAACVDIRHGKPVALAPGDGAGLYRLQSAEGLFIGLGEIVRDGELIAKRLINTAI
jgi:tRNA pseudouridine55 synthase